MRDASRWRLCLPDLLGLGVWYWPVALVVAYFGISIFYIRRAHAHGLETRIRNFVIAGIHIAVIVTAMGYWAVHLPIGQVNFLGLLLIAAIGFALAQRPLRRPKP